MSDMLDFAVTPSRLGEMFVNTLVNTADMLFSRNYAMAAQARSGPAALLAPLPTMPREHLLDFIAGITTQAELVLDHFTPPTFDSQAAQGESADADPIDRELDISATTSRVAAALQLTGESATRDEGFGDLGICDHDLQGMICLPELARHTHEALMRVQQQIDGALEHATRRDLTMFVAGHRSAQWLNSNAE